MWTWFHRLASPPTFYRLADRFAPWLAVLSALLIGYGLVGGLVLAPADYQQGEAFRIIYVHVPAAWLSLSGYVAMAVAALVAIIWRMKLAECVVVAIAPVGASWTALALVTGMLWGKPMWGAYWVWDARLTSELVLLFLFLGVIGLYHAFEDRRQGARAAAFLAIIGIINVPIVHFSVNWWNTLHQGSTVNVFGQSKISADMLWPLLTMTLATKFYYLASLFSRARTDLLALEGGKDWVRKIAEDEASR